MSPKSIQTAIHSPGRRQAGVSLVELLVALVIGLIIILGAGQLFLTGFVNFKQVELLGEKQSALLYGSEVLLRDVRRAKVESTGDTTIVWDDTNKRLSLVVANREDTASCKGDEFVEKEYWVGGSGDLMVGLLSCLDQGFSEIKSLSLSEPVSSGFSTSNPFQASQVQDGSGDDIPGVWELSFNLRADASNAAAADTYTFLAVNRTMALNAD